MQLHFAGWTAWRRLSRRDRGYRAAGACPQRRQCDRQSVSHQQEERASRRARGAVGERKTSAAKIGAAPHTRRRLGKDRRDAAGPLLPGALGSYFLGAAARAIPARFPKTPHSLVSPPSVLLRSSDLDYGSRLPVARIAFGSELLKLGHLLQSLQSERKSRIPSRVWRSSSGPPSSCSRRPRAEYSRTRGEPTLMRLQSFRRPGRGRRKVEDVSETQKGDGRFGRWHARNRFAPEEDVPAYYDRVVLVAESVGLCLRVLLDVGLLDELDTILAAAPVV